MQVCLQPGLRVTATLLQHLVHTHSLGAKKESATSTNKRIINVSFMSYYRCIECILLGLAPFPFLFSCHCSDRPTFNQIRMELKTCNYQSMARSKRNKQAKWHILTGRPRLVLFHSNAPQLTVVRHDKNCFYLILLMLKGETQADMCFCVLSTFFMNHWTSFIKACRQYPLDLQQNPFSG